VTEKNRTHGPPLNPIEVRHARVVALRTTSPAPFVVGVPRSGTTLLRLMLDAHPVLAIPPETHFISAAPRAVSSSREPARALCSMLLESPRWGDFGIEERALLERLEALEPFVLADAVRAFYLLYAERFGKRRWGDKTPPYLASMTTIRALLPEARFVHLIRDGRDVGCSILPRSWGPTTIAEAAAWWRRQILHARRQASNLSGYMELHYEELTAHPERALKAVCALIDLPYDGGMLGYHRRADERMNEIDRDLHDRTGRVSVSASERRQMHVLTRQPPQAGLSRWREELTRKQVLEFETVAGDLLEELGYELSTADRSSR